MTARRVAVELALAVAVTLLAAALVARVPAIRRLVDPGCGCK